MFSWAVFSFFTVSFIWTPDGLIKSVAQPHCPTPRMQSIWFVCTVLAQMLYLTPKAHGKSGACCKA